MIRSDGQLNQDDRGIALGVSNVKIQMQIYYDPKVI